jgi:hypothetical protein
MEFCFSRVNHWRDFSVDGVIIGDSDGRILEGIGGGLLEIKYRYLPGSLRKT